MYKKFMIEFVRITHHVIGFFLPKSVVLYGSGFNRYIGHTKYLFESKYGRERSYWVTPDRSEFYQLRKAGKRVLLKNSLKHILYTMLSKNFYITHNVSDVFVIKPIGCIVTNLWHGVPIKHIGFDSKLEREWIARKVESGLSIPYDDWDIFVAQSEFHKNIIAGAMRIPRSKIEVKLPDSLVYLSQKSCSRKSPENHKEVVLYMPTFRNGCTDVYENTLKKIYHRFNLESYDIWLKLHPLDSVESFLVPPGVHWVGKDVDPIELLSNVDVLVSDYSSVIYDFEITGRRIYLCHDDMDIYASLNGGLYTIDARYEVL